jgi:hypothetical protein
MSALQALRDAGLVLREAPLLVVAGAGAALVGTFQTAADSGLLSLLDLLVGAWVTAGLVGVASTVLTDRHHGGFVATANAKTLSLVGAQLLAGIGMLLLLALPALFAWSALEPQLVTLVQGGTPAFGLDDLLTGALLVAVGFLASLAFGLVAPAVVHGHGAVGSIGESLSRIVSNRRAALWFGLVNALVALVAVGPGLYTFLAGLLANPTADPSIDGTAFLLLWIGGTFSTTFGPVYATAFYERVDGRAPR